MEILEDTALIIIVVFIIFILGSLSNRISKLEKKLR